MRASETKCTGCGACAARCPKGCITMEEDRSGFLRPKIREEDCIHCGACDTACPVGKQREGAVLGTFAASIRQKATRYNSSSGGVFTALALRVLEEGGVVFGAAFDGTRLRHVSARQEGELGPLRGSKYLQSDASAGIREALRALGEGKTVLFTGTPCQIAGLRQGVGEHPNLIAVEVICHGVPSNKVWDAYLEELEQKAGAPVRSVHFRDKTHGWTDYRMRVTFANGKKKSTRRALDPYLRGYQGNLFLRESCYDCPFKDGGSGADLSLGDFWGLRKMAPDLDDDRGTSLVLVRTARGQALWDRCAGDLNITPVDTAAALRHNPAAWTSVPKNPNREAFLEALGKEPFTILADRFAPVSLKTRIKSRIPAKLKRLRK